MNCLQLHWNHKNQAREYLYSTKPKIHLLGFKNTPQSMNPHSKKLVLFGAGKIGRSFIGSLFSKGGYEVVFVDIDEKIIEALNIRRNYDVIIKADYEERINISNVRGVSPEDEKQVINEIADTDIMAVSLGTRGLALSIPLIAKGLVKRYTESRIPLDIIIAENLRNGAEYMKKKLLQYLPEWFPFDSMVGLVETSIGKMVPIMTKDESERDILQVFAEPYSTLILDKQGFVNPIPEIDGLAPKANIKAWVDRKLFIHNLGHVAAAYYGHYHYPGYTYMYEILEHQEVKDFTRQVMMQSSKILQALYPGIFTDKQLRDHIEDLIFRFQNEALGDTVFRVGCDLQRKLGANDRLMAPFKSGIILGLPVKLIASLIYFGTCFLAIDENGMLFIGDAEFHEMIEEKGIKEVLSTLGDLSHIEWEYLAELFPQI